MRGSAFICIALLFLVGGAGAEEDGAEYVAALCSSCHGPDLIRQQRLTKDQWRATVDKMVSWGAQADDADLKRTLVSHLSAEYGPDAGPFRPERVSPRDASAALSPLPDGVLANGDAAKGKGLYAADCAGCHGADARGELGLALVDKYFLFRAPDFAAIVRNGRGELMPGRSMDDSGVAALLAYLRGLPSPTVRAPGDTEPGS